MKRFLCWVLAIAIGEILGIYTAQLLASGMGVHLTGRVSAVAEETDEGRFQIIGDSGSVTLDVSAWDYLTDYLRASNGREITLTLEPK